MTLAPDIVVETRVDAEGGTGSATFSPTRLYRYTLSRTWNPGKPRMVWIMLNPSTADAEVDDRTIRRCIGFAKREGCGGIEVLNLYALRATTPKELLAHPDPEGPGNREAWQRVLSGHEGPVVAAWGAFWGDHLYSLPWPSAIEECTASFQCLGMTKNGEPCHPLYLAAETPLVPWEAS